jgi:dTDP-glucose 4,6-dehydratase
MARVVVTGGAGFLGSHLCDRLLALGWQVVCLDDLSTGDAANLKSAQLHPEFTARYEEITSGCDVEGPVDLVLHLASAASPTAYAQRPLQTLRAGSDGTIHAAELARRHGARFVFASTSEVYGNPRVHPQTEDYVGHVDPTGPRAMYDEAKRFGEAATRTFHTQGLDAGVVRIFNTYGPRMRAA